jgi:hypothetical protein
MIFRLLTALVAAFALCHLACYYGKLISMPRLWALKSAGCRALLSAFAAGLHAIGTLCILPGPAQSFVLSGTTSMASHSIHIGKRRFRDG